MENAKALSPEAQDKQAEEAIDRFMWKVMYCLIGACILIPAFIFVGGLFLLGAPLWVGILAYIFLFLK